MKNSFLLPLSLCGLPEEGVAQIKDVPSCLRIWLKGMCHPSAPSISGLQFISDIAKLITRNSHHRRKGVFPLTIPGDNPFI